jgi:hypothetical protein
MVGLDVWVGVVEAVGKGVSVVRCVAVSVGVAWSGSDLWDRAVGVHVEVAVCVGVTEDVDVEVAVAVLEDANVQITGGVYVAVGEGVAVGVLVGVKVRDGGGGAISVGIGLMPEGRRERNANMPKTRNGISTRNICSRLLLIPL